MAGDWPIQRVGELADSISETHRLDKPELVFLNTSDVFRGRILHHEYSQVATWPGQAKKSIKKNDILFSEIRPANGRYAYVDTEADDFVVSTKLMVIRARDQVLPRYLFHFLTSIEITGWLQHLAESRSGTFPQITFDQVAELELSLPPRNVQQAIVSFIDAIDDKIELNRRMNETLEAMARAIFKSWFVDFDPVRAKMRGEQPAGLAPEIAALFPDALVETELGEAPKGWAVGTLGDVAKHIQRTVRPDKLDPSIPYIALEHMPKQSIALSLWGSADGIASNKYEFKTGEFLFGKLRPYFHKVGIAPCDGVCSTDIVVVVPESTPWFGFVLEHISSVAFVEYTNAHSTGTKMPRTNWADMARYPVVVPQVAVANAYTSQVRPVCDRIVANIHEAITLATLRNTLLPKLISGELRVADAERLVARIP